MPLKTLKFRQNFNPDLIYSLGILDVTKSTIPLYLHAYILSQYM
jgi:hypothetical protein